MAAGLILHQESYLLAAYDTVAVKVRHGLMAHCKPCFAVAFHAVVLERAVRSVLQPHAVALVVGYKISVKERARVALDADPSTQVADKAIVFNHALGIAEQHKSAAVPRRDEIPSENGVRVVPDTFKKKSHHLT